MPSPETKYLLDEAPPGRSGFDTGAPAASGEAEVEPTAPGPAGWGASWGFRITMLRYHRLVFRVAWQLLQDRAEAEDVCQECFLRYWRHQQQVRQSKEWLLRVARNLSLSRLRRQGRVSYCEDEVVAVISQNAADPVEGLDEQPEQRFHQEQRAQSLRQAVTRLPEPQRSLVVLFDLEGLDGAACARILDLSPSQVKVYLHRARKRLRSQLEHCL